MLASIWARVAGLTPLNKYRLTWIGLFCLLRFDHSCTVWSFLQFIFDIFHTIFSFWFFPSLLDLFPTIFSYFLPLSFSFQSRSTFSFFLPLLLCLQLNYSIITIFIALFSLNNNLWVMKTGLWVVNCSVCCSPQRLFERVKCPSFRLLNISFLFFNYFLWIFLKIIFKTDL